ncbi:MAG TPA: helix-turn-helix transcriptional regulator [Kofleriaceae bacterium]|nr:helix-turn-helix transcriptional regulator [Kofleriaceae bacterium]
MNYDRAIKTVRALRGMSQQDLAHRMQVDEAFVSRLGKSGNPPSGRTLERVASALDVPMYLLILLASEQHELGSMSTQQAEALGKQLLSLLLATEAPAARKSKRRSVR